MSSVQEKSSGSTSKKFIPSVGKDFDVTACQHEVRLISAIESYEASRTRNFLARTLIVYLFSGLTLAAAYSVYVGDFHYLTALWVAVGVIVSSITTYYFKRSSGEDDE